MHISIYCLLSIKIGRSDMARQEYGKCVEQGYGCNGCLLGMHASGHVSRTHVGLNIAVLLDNSYNVSLI